MQSGTFQPGFRLSAVDCVVLVVGTVAAVWLWNEMQPVAIAIVVVTLHFFLFCNVFRISRPPELIWAAIFLALSYGTIVLEALSWPVSIAVAVAVAAVAIGLDMRKPSYHGVLWRRINPRLPERYAARKK